MADTTELEIFSDFNCTWCYFDKPAIKKLNAEYEIDIIWRAFPLHPAIPETGLPIRELFGNNLSLMTDKMKALEDKAATLGLPLAKRNTISDSRLAQELAKWAEEKGQLEKFQDAIYSAYFSHGLDISSQEVLLEIIDRLDLPKNQALTALETRKYAGAVDSDWALSEKLEIMVAPTYIMNGRKRMGSQSYQKLEEFMRANQIPQKG